MFTISTFTAAVFVLLIVLGFAARRRGWQARSFLPLVAFLVVNLGWTFLGEAWLHGRSYRDARDAMIQGETLVRLFTVACVLAGVAMAVIRDPGRKQ